MPARSALFVFLLAAVAVPLAAAPRDPIPPEPALRGAQCLDPDLARGFTPIDDRVVLIDAGRRHYRIEVTPSCSSLDTTSVIGFRGDPILNRVCGMGFDAILVRGGHPCRIEHMQLISKAEYRQALREREERRRTLRAERRARRDKARQQARD